MATIIVRTNPDPRRDGRFACSHCKAVLDTFAEAKTCAEDSYRRRTGRDPVPYTIEEKAA